MVRAITLLPFSYDNSHVADGIQQPLQACRIGSQPYEGCDCRRSHLAINRADAARCRALDRLLNNPRPVACPKAEDRIGQGGGGLDVADPVQGLMPADAMEGLIEVIAVDGRALGRAEVTGGSGVFQPRNPASGVVQGLLQDAAGG